MEVTVGELASNCCNSYSHKLSDVFVSEVWRKQNMLILVHGPLGAVEATFHFVHNC